MKGVFKKNLVKWGKRSGFSYCLREAKFISFPFPVGMKKIGLDLLNDQSDE